jgi:hypothetical protein
MLFSHVMSDFSGRKLRILWKKTSNHKEWTSHCSLYKPFVLELQCLTVLVTWSLCCDPLPQSRCFLLLTYLNYDSVRVLRGAFTTAHWIIWGGLIKELCCSRAQWPIPVIPVYVKGRDRSVVWGQPCTISETLSEKQLKQEGLRVWIKWQSSCLACVRFWVQTPVSSKKPKQNQNTLAIVRHVYHLALWSHEERKWSPVPGSQSYLEMLPDLCWYLLCRDLSIRSYPDFSILPSDF